MVGLALIVGFTVGSHRQGERRVGTRLGEALARSGIWIATFIVGVVLSVVLLFLSIALTERVWQGVHAVPTAESSASEAGKSSAGADADGSAISNAMTAIGVAIAVVTLVLTVGTSWFATQQRELQMKLQELDRQLVRNAQREEVERLRIKAAVSGLAAKRAAARWIEQLGTGSDLFAVRFLDISLELDQLSVDDIEARRRAFVTLAQLFDSDPWTEELSTIAAYTEDCHCYARALCCIRQEPMGVLAGAEFESLGLACRVFDRSELKRVMGIVGST